MKWKLTTEEKLQNYEDVLQFLVGEFKEVGIAEPEEGFAENPLALIGCIKELKSKYKSADSQGSKAKVEELFVVRFYDGFDNAWMDVSVPVSAEKAHEIWNEKTNKGTKNATFNEIDYYRVFPADTIMKHTY